MKENLKVFKGQLPRNRRSLKNIFRKLMTCLWRVPIFRDELTSEKLWIEQMVNQHHSRVSEKEKAINETMRKIETHAIDWMK